MEALQALDRWSASKGDEFRLYQLIARLLIARGPQGSLANSNDLATVDEMRDLLTKRADMAERAPPCFDDFDANFKALALQVEEAAFELTALMSTGEFFEAIVGSPARKGLSPIEHVRLGAQLTERLNESACGTAFLERQVHPLGDGVFHLNRFPALLELDETKVTDAMAAFLAEETLSHYLFWIGRQLIKTSLGDARRILRLTARLLLEEDYPELTTGSSPQAAKAVQRMMRRLARDRRALARTKPPIAIVLVSGFALGLLADDFRKDPSLRIGFELSGQVADFVAGTRTVVNMIRTPGIGAQAAGGAMLKTLGNYAVGVGIASSALDTLDAALISRDSSVALGNAMAVVGSLLILVAEGSVGGPIGIGLVIGGSLIAFLTQDAPLKSWLKACRFGNDPAKNFDPPNSLTFQFKSLDDRHNVARQISAFYSLSTPLAVTLDEDDDGRYDLEVDLAEVEAYASSVLRVIRYDTMGQLWSTPHADTLIPLDSPGDEQLGWVRTSDPPGDGFIKVWKGKFHPDLIKSSGVFLNNYLEVQLDIVPSAGSVRLFSNRVPV